MSVGIAAWWGSWIAALVVLPIALWGIYLMLGARPFVFYNELTDDRLIIQRTSKTEIRYSKIESVELGKYGEVRRTFESLAASWGRLMGGGDTSFFIDNWVFVCTKGWIWTRVLFIPFPTRKLRVVTEDREEFVSDLRRRIAESLS